MRQPVASTPMRVSVTITRRVNDEAREEIAKWEGGHRTTAYKDLTGTWTIGAGITTGSGIAIVREGLTVTPEKAREMFDKALSKFEKHVNEMVKVDLTDNEYAALVSFCYNIGPGAFRNSTLLKKLNAGNLDAVPSEMMKWVYGKVNGKTQKIRGLENRRKAEIALWNRGAPVLSAHATATTQPATSLAAKVESAAPVLAAASGMGSVVAGEGPVQWALAAVMVVAAVAAAVYFIRRNRG